MKQDNTQLAILAGTVIGLGGLVLAAVLFGAETSQVRMLQYLSSAVPLILGYAFIGSRQKSTDEKSSDTHDKVTHLAGTLNGKLDKRFSDLENRLTDRISESKVMVAPTATGELAIITAPKDENNDE